nr:GP3 [Lopma virus]
MGGLLSGLFVFICWSCCCIVDNFAKENSHWTCFYFPTNVSSTVNISIDLKVTLTDFVNIYYGTDGKPVFINAYQDGKFYFNDTLTTNITEGFTFLQEDDEKGLVKNIQSLGVVLFAAVVSHYPEVLHLTNVTNKHIKLQHNKLCVNASQQIQQASLNSTQLVSWFYRATSDLAIWHIEAFGPFVDSFLVLCIAWFLR